jgi:hypothetical protein
MGENLKKDFNLIIITGLFIVFSVISVWFLWKRPLALTLVLYILVVIELLAIKNKKIIILFILCGIGGAVFESISVWYGVWTYNFPTLGNIPLWLIPGWGNAGVFIVCFYKLLGKIYWLDKKSE